MPAFAAAFLAIAALVAAAAPVLGLRDPGSQPDGLVLRNLPPASRAIRVALADGSSVWAHEVSRTPDGGFAFRRGETWTALRREQLAGGDPERAVSRPLFVLGTDGFGRDLLSRIVYGGRVSLAVALAAGALAVVLGGAVGITSGLAGGGVDGLAMRGVDLAASIPRLFLLLLVAALWRPSAATAIVAIGATSWMTGARVVRARVAAMRESDLVRAARAAGASPFRVALRHVLPAVGGVLAAEAALRVAQSLLLESSLSFLGMGVTPPTPSWGSIIADGRDRLSDAWWISMLPGLALVATAIALARIGDAVEAASLRRAGAGDHAV